MKNYDEQKYYLPEPIVKKHDNIKQELGQQDILKNNFIVSKKISKVEVHGLDPFCRITSQQVKNLLKADKSEAIPLYRKEAEDRLMKKVQETKVKKEVVKNENFSEWLEKQKKEAEEKAEKDRKKGVNSPNKSASSELFNLKRFSQIHQAGSMIIGLDKLLKKKQEEQEQSSDRPIVNKNPIENIKKSYRKDENIPNLHTLHKNTIKKPGKTRNLML